MWVDRERRLDRRAAIVALVFANANRGSNTEPFELADFMVNVPEPGDEPHEQSIEEQMRVVEQLARGRQL